MKVSKNIDLLDSCTSDLCLLPEYCAIKAPRACRKPEERGNVRRLTVRCRVASPIAAHGAQSPADRLSSNQTWVADTHSVGFADKALSAARATFPRRHLLTGFAAAALFGCSAKGWSDPSVKLINPYDATALRLRKGRQAGSHLQCRPAPAPMRDLIVPNFYTDPPIFSQIDPERFAARDAAVRPLQILVRTVTDNADRWASSLPIRGDFAACAATSLDAAARADAFLGQVNQQGGYERKWTWCGLALAHLKLVQAAEYAPHSQALVRAWLARGFAAMREIYDRPPRGRPSTQINNHMTWAGLTAMAIGLATEDHEAWNWGLLRLDRTLAQVDLDGFLPQELMRGSKAWHYHIFTISPLSLGAVLARANGIDIADGRFHRLARRSLEGYSDTSGFEQRTGRKQDSVSDRPDVGWLEIYAGEFGASDALIPLRGRRPQRRSWLGGDLTLWHARDL